MAGKGCRKAAFIVGIGCLAVPVAVALILAALVLTARGIARREGPARPEPAALTIPGTGAPAASGGAGTGTPSAPAAPAPPAGEAPPPVAGRDLPALGGGPFPGSEPPPTRLRLLLEEGDFTVRAGPPGTDIKVDGLFDPRDYELTQLTEEGEGGGRDVTIRFRSKRSWLLRLFAGRLQGGATKLAVTIPEGMPTTLDLSLAKGESHVDLGGLTLTALTANLAMGEHDLTFSRPLAAPLKRADIRASMGELEITRLGNASPEVVSVAGSMGEVRVDFLGAWRPAARSKARIRFSMGELRVRVPKEVRIADTSKSRVSLGDSDSRALRGDQTDDPNAPVLELDLAGSMGEIRVVHQ